jgi:hypothetical protein
LLPREWVRPITLLENVSVIDLHGFLGNKEFVSDIAISISAAGFMTKNCLSGFRRGLVPRMELYKPFRRDTRTTGFENKRPDTNHVCHGIPQNLFAARRIWYQSVEEE